MTVLPATTAASMTNKITSLEGKKIIRNISFKSFPDTNFFFEVRKRLTDQVGKVMKMHIKVTKFTFIGFACLLNSCQV